jgi:predicted HTH transcriptional regulator
VPREESTILDLLKEYAYITEDHGSWAITNLGALLFANRLADFENLRFRGLNLRRYEGNNNLVMINERHSEAGYAVEFDDLLDWLENNTSKDKIISSRTRAITFPRVAMREFMANVMVHQDFTITGMPLTIEIFGNRIVFTNPGSLLNDANRLIDLPPHSRNETLAQAMLQVDLCERRGSGYDRAVEGIESMCLPPYKVEAGNNFTRVTMYPKKSFKEMTPKERLMACYQHACILFEKDEEMNNQSLRERFELEKNKSSVASRIIAEAVETGLLKSAHEDNEAKKFATYIPYYG